MSKERVMKATRVADVVEGGSKAALQVEIRENGDVFFYLLGTDLQGNPSKTVIQFLSNIDGGGYHPRTIKAAFNLVQAMHADNQDPANPSRYRLDKLKESLPDLFFPCQDEV